MVIILKKKLQIIIIVIVFTFLTSIFSIWEINLGFTPIPITLQLVIGLMAGAILGSRLGALSQIIYVLLGLFGIPIFSGGEKGISYITGLSGGYILGFVIASFVTGLIIEHYANNIKDMHQQFVIYLFSMLIGLFIIYFFGVAQLMYISNSSLEIAISNGMLPFLMLDIIKIIFGAIVSVILKRFIYRIIYYNVDE